MEFLGVDMFLALLELILEYECISVWPKTYLHP